MTPQEQIRAIAELDGWIHETFISQFDRKTVCDRWTRGQKGINAKQTYSIPNYLTSRDTIVSVIEEQDSSTQILIAGELYQLCRHLHRDKDVSFILATAKHLSEALLRATGKWKE